MSDKRQDARVDKRFTLIYCLKDQQYKKDLSTIKDISKGGVNFTASFLLPKDSILLLELTIPYLLPKKLIVDAVVLSCVKIGASGMIYDVRAKFINISDEAMLDLNVVEQRIGKGV